MSQNWYEQKKDLQKSASGNYVMGRRFLFLLVYWCQGLFDMGPDWQKPYPMKQRRL